VDEREALQYGLEHLGKIMTIRAMIEQPAMKDLYARATYAPVTQRDGLFDSQLEQVPAALQSMDLGDFEKARQVLTQVARAEAGVRRMNNYVRGNQAHHLNGLGGLAVLTPDLTFNQSNQVFDGLTNQTGFTFGTQPLNLASVTPTFAHPTAHTSPYTYNTGAYKVQQNVYSQLRNPTVEGRIAEALPHVQWERETSLGGANLDGEKAFREILSNKLGISEQELTSMLRDDSRKKGSNVSLARSAFERLDNTFSKQELLDMAAQAQAGMSNELYIPKYESFAHKRTGNFGPYKKTVDPAPTAIDNYILSERPGLTGALDILRSKRV